MERMKLTKFSVKGIPFMQFGQVIIRDTELIGFGVCVGKRSKTYFAQREVRGRTIRAKIGRHSLMTAEEARREARQILAKIERGEFPRAAGREPEGTVHTLSDALESCPSAMANGRPRTSASRAGPRPASGNEFSPP